MWSVHVLLCSEKMVKFYTLMREDSPTRANNSSTLTPSNDTIFNVANEKSWYLEY